MNFGISIFPERSVQDFVDSFRKRYDPRYRFIPPHITLKEKFELAEHQVEPMIEKLEAIAKQATPFQIKFHKVSHFYPTSPTLYLAIQGAEPIVELHKQIKTAIPGATAYDYIPHLTIGQNMETDELHDVYSNLHSHTYDLDSRVDRFHLMYQSPDDTWEIYHSFVLGK